MKKRIPIEQLKCGMFVVGMDKPWLQTPFLLHKRTIKREEDIALLKQYGIREVTIDPMQGLDADAPSNQEGPAEAALNSSEERDSAPHDGRRQEVTASDLGVTETPAQQDSHAALAAELPMARAVRAMALAAAQSFFARVKAGASIDNQDVKKAVSGLLDSIVRRPAASLLLLQMRQFDADLFAHAVNVCVIALVVGTAQGFTREQLNLLGVGALLHDVGKVRLPRSLTRKTGIYTPQERRFRYMHPRLGAVLLSQLDEIPNESCRIVAEHHERADGSGYPEGRAGKDLSPLSQLVGIADVYDALVSGRGGQPALLPTHALRHLFRLGKAQHFDRGWVERVIRVLGIYPVGAVVELNTGEHGVVIAVNPKEALRPTVQFITADGRAEPRFADLSVPVTGEPERTILHAQDPAAMNVDLAQLFYRNSLA